jgi:hypothetical protein
MEEEKERGEEEEDIAYTASGCVRLGRSRQEWEVVASVCEGRGRKKRSGVRDTRRERQEE